MDRVSENLLSAVDAELARRVRAMASALAARGIQIKVTSGLRSTARQATLYANRANNTYPVAAPGTSKHEKGLAVDIVSAGARSSAVTAAIGEAGEREGLSWNGRFTKPDAVHFELPDAGLMQAGGERVIDGSTLISQAKEQATAVRVVAVLGLAALVIRFLR